jgi:hypothetical protein
MHWRERAKPRTDSLPEGTVAVLFRVDAKPSGSIFYADCPDLPTLAVTAPTMGELRELVPLGIKALLQAIYGCDAPVLKARVGLAGQDGWPAAREIWAAFMPVAAFVKAA